MWNTKSIINWLRCSSIDTNNTTNLFTTIAIRWTLENKTNISNQLRKKDVLLTMVPLARDKDFHNRPYYTKFALLVLDMHHIYLNDYFLVNIHYYSLHDMIYLDIQCLNHKLMYTRKSSEDFHCKIQLIFIDIPMTMHWLPTLVNRLFENIVEHD